MTQYALSDSTQQTILQLEEGMWTTKLRFNETWLKRHLHREFKEFGRSGRVYHYDSLIPPKAQEISCQLPLPELTISSIDKNTVLVTYDSHVRYGSTTSRKLAIYFVTGAACINSDDPITLVSHHLEWKTIFQTESILIWETLGASIFRMEHIGSTSVASLKAKPIIDIAVESKNFPPTDVTVKALQDLSYEDHGESGVPGRLFLTKGSPRQFNLHWCDLGSSIVRRQVAFRDALRSDTKLIEQYEALKSKAAIGETIDSKRYAESKSTFIASVLSNHPN